MKTIATFLISIIIFYGFLGSAMGQAVVPGDIIITEFMADPNATIDGNGEYVELYNKRSVDINIDGFTLKDDGSNSHTIDNGGLLTIPAEGFLVLAVSASPGFSPDYIYDTGGSFSLVNSGDQIVLVDNNGQEIARVNYTGTQVSAGISSELNAISNVDENGEIDPLNFEDSGTALGNDDFGSPGTAGITELSENPTVRFSENGKTVNEVEGAITIEVILDDPDGNSVEVDVVFQQEPSTAQATDFTTSTTQTVSFGPGAPDGDTQNASFTLNNDLDYEGIQKASLILANISTSGAATISGQTEYTLTIEDDDIPNVVINEIHADPDGDADGDGEVSTDDDEFVEIVNAESVSVDIAGWTISDASGVKHTFEEGTLLAPGAAIVVFGSIDFVGSFGGSNVQGTGSLGLNNSTDSVILKDDLDNIIDSHNYGGEGGDNQSLVRDPDITGSFVKHSLATGSGGDLFSPGFKIDGSLFTTSLVIEGNAGWRMLSAPVENMAISDITDNTPIQGFEDGFAKNFYTGYDGSAFTAPVDLSGNLNSGEGFIFHFYNNNAAGSSTLPVVIDIGSGSEPSGDVSVAVHSNGDGWNLLGNPFSTAFDITSITSTGGNLASSIGQIWSDEDESYILTSANDNKVATGQGFFIQNDTSAAGTPATSVTLPISGKTTGARFYKSNQKKSGFIQFALKARDIYQNRAQTDLSSVLYFSDEADAAWDLWDAEKLYPLKYNYSLLNIISASDGKVLTQDSRPFENEGEEVFHLEVESMNVSSSQVLQWNKSSNIPENWTFTFRDNKTGEEMLMDENFSYEFIHDEIRIEQNGNKESKFKEVLTVRKKSSDPRFVITLNKGNAVSNEPADQPQEISLEQNYPNPFNPTTSIYYSIPEVGEVNLTIYNVMGQRVHTLVDERKSAGEYRVNWNASKMASGIYYYRFNYAGEVITRQMTLIK